MSEGHVTDILERLEEIEKLQTKLRNLVPRVFSSNSQNMLETLKNLSKRSSFSTRLSFPIHFPIISNETEFKRNNEVSKNNRQSGVKGGKHEQNSSENPDIFKRRSIDVPRKSESLINVQDTLKNTKKNLTTERLKNKLMKVFIKNRDPKKIRKSLVDHSAQTSERELHVINEKTYKKKERKVGESFKRLLERSNYCFVDENRVTIPDHYPGNNAPCRMQTLLSVSNEETETLKVLSSAARVSIDVDTANSLTSNSQKNWKFPIKRISQFLESYIEK